MTGTETSHIKRREMPRIAIQRFELFSCCLQTSLGTSCGEKPALPAGRRIPFGSVSTLFLSCCCLSCVGAVPQSLSCSRGWVLAASRGACLPAPWAGSGPTKSSLGRAITCSWLYSEGLQLSRCLPMKLGQAAGVEATPGPGAMSI